MADQATRNEFDAAVEAIRQNPEDNGSWDIVMSLADDLQCPDEVANLFKEILARDLRRDVAEALGERAAGFLDEWFGDTPGLLRDVLMRVLELEPEAAWAFQQLTESFTQSEAWDDLLELYDHAIANALDDEHRIQLLDEAAQVAKDIANQPDKAIAYMQKLVPLRPDDSQLEHSLERLLERHERWRDLIDLWNSKLGSLPADERDQSRVRIASCWLDNLAQPAKALEAVKPLLSEATGADAEACDLLERVITFPKTDAQVRNSALDLLRIHYESTGRPREIVRVLEAAIEMSIPEESLALREEAGARLAALDEDVAAMNHYAALLLINPGHSVAQGRMLALARRSSEFARYAEGIAAAANACDQDIPRKVALLAEAARTRLDMLEDEAGAIELFQAAMAQPGLAREEETRVARRLAALLARAERHAERLAVLERLAQVESSATARKTVIGEAARLAESQGEIDRALALWQGRIDEDPEDRFALDAMIALLENSQRWEPLITNLGVRVSTAMGAGQKRADLIRIAEILDKELNAAEQAIAAWLRVAEECGENSETVDALADLLTRTGQWPELAALLERASGREIARVTERLVRLSDAYGQHLGAPDRALVGFRNALTIDPKNEPAREGMTRLLEVESCRADAASALAQNYRENAEWERFLGLLEPRLADAGDQRQTLAILREAAEIQEREVGDLPAALQSMARIFPLVPKDRGVEGQILRLAQATGQWEVAASALSAAAEAAADDANEVAHLYFELGSILESRLDRPEEAHRAFLSVLGIQPSLLAAVRAVTRLGTRLGRWDDVALGLLGYVREANAIEASLLQEIEQVADASGTFPAAAAALSSILDQGARSLPARLAFELYHRVATWYRDRLGDAAAAEQALIKALSFDDTRVDGIRDLVALQRERSGPAYFDSLRKLAELEPGNIDVQRELVDVAFAHIDDQTVRLATLTSLFTRASAVWRGTSQGTGQADPQTYVRWALDKLVEYHTQAGNPSIAVDLLVDSSRLPFDQATKMAMRHQAARIAADVMRDNEVAIQLYQSILTQDSRDIEAMDRLGALYAAADRIAENLSLRKLQLGVESDPERRLELRLEIAHLVGEVQRRGGRNEALRANLDERPGHLPSVNALTELLVADGSSAELLDLLEDQARRVEESERETAAILWGKAAEIAENQTKELDRAIVDYRRVVDIQATEPALRALARLYMERHQPAMAVPWFENLLGVVSAKEKPDIVYKLAQAHLGADQIERAIQSLQAHVDHRAPVLELRSLLADLYRKTRKWESLAWLLTESLPLLEDRDTAVEYAREAARVYSNELESPNKAVPALEKALSYVPGDRSLRIQLGVGLRHAGQPEKARDMLLEIVEEFGRRRSAERANVHVELAMTFQALGQEDEALAQMELASKMDTGNVGIQKRVAELAREAGELDKAERTYRSMLLVVRRNPPSEDDVKAVGVSEILYELHKLAEQRGQTEQSKELLETALETAVQSDAEVRRLRRSLLAHQQGETLLRVIDMRLDANPDPASRADLLADKAEVLDKTLGRTQDALDTVLQALKLFPMRADLHDTARDLARRGPGVKVYTSAAVNMADNMRRREDPPIVAELLLRAGNALETDLDDAAGALRLYQRVEQLGERTAEAYYAISRVAGVLGDTTEQMRVLEAMLALATSDEPSPEQIDALYRLSEIFVEHGDKRAQGIDLLQRAFSAEPRYGQAGRILMVAAAAEPDNERVMNLYERVARAGNSWEMLLDFLERRASLPGATPPQVREAVHVAVEHDQHERAEALYGRAVQAARESDEGIAAAVWAALGLIERYTATGNLRGACDLIGEIAHVAEDDEVKRLSLALAHAAEPVDLPLAAGMYEFLRERNPYDRQIWEPLVELYRRAGDSERLQALIHATLPTLVDPVERNALRMQHARYLIDALQQIDEAINVLRDVLLDDPDHAEGATLLESVLRQQGDAQALVDFLWQRFDGARERGNPDTITDVAKRLGELLASMGSPEAVNVYRAALESAPESRDLLQLVLQHLSPEADLRERAELVERLLQVETPEAASALARELCGIWEHLEDAAGYQRALELGHQRNPADGELHQMLESWYNDNQQWAELTALMRSDAEHLAENPATVTHAVARLRQAAAVYRDTMADLGATATMLRRARELAPTDAELVTELAGCLAMAGDRAAAVEVVSEALAGDIQGSSRVDLLLLRAELYFGLADEAAAVSDLEEAHGIDAERIRPQLINALEHRLVRAQESGERELERATTMRLSQLLAQAGDTDRQRMLLVHWIEREPNDLEVLYALRDMDKAGENWPGVVAVCARLVHIEEGEAQAASALELAEAAELAGQPGDAQPGLELVHHAQPANERIRNRLRRIYELAGAHRELATVLLADGDHSDDPEVRYSAYRRAAEVLVFQLQDPVAAAIPAGKALELRPDDHDATVLYVDVLVAGNRTDDAIAVLEPAINGHKRRSPKLAELQQRLARVYGVLGDQENQLGWLKKAFDVDRKSGEIAAELAQLATAMQDYDLALKPLRAITLMDNTGPISRVMALLWEAKIEYARGNRAKAELWAKKALREDPEYAEAQQFLDDLSRE